MFQPLQLFSFLFLFYFFFCFYASVEQEQVDRVHQVPLPALLHQLMCQADVNLKMKYSKYTILFKVWH